MLSISYLSRVNSPLIRPAVLEPGGHWHKTVYLLMTSFEGSLAGYEKVWPFLPTAVGYLVSKMQRQENEVLPDTA